MTSSGSPLRLGALVLAVVLTVTLAAPARAEAEVFATVAIATLVVVGVILIVYLIVANTRGPRMGTEASPSLMVCVESEGTPGGCRLVSGAAPAGVAAEVAPQS